MASLITQPILEKEKYCPKCDSTKVTTLFYPNRFKGDGLSSVCRDCTKKFYAKRTKEKEREYHRAWMYRLTAKEYADILLKQNNKCANNACNVKSTDARNLDVDHDHATGKVRGLLCRFCNTGLGNFRDNLQLLQGIQDYISKTFVVGLTQDSF